MKVFLILSMLLFPGTLPAAPLVAVPAIGTGPGVSKQLALPFADVLGQAVESLGRYQVMSAREVEEHENYAEAAAKLQCNTTSCLAEAARLLHVDLVLKGNMTRAAGRFLLDLKLVDSHMWRLAGAISRIVSSADDVQDMVHKLFRKSFKLAPLLGKRGAKNNEIGTGGVVDVVLASDAGDARALIDGESRVDLPARLKLAPGSHQVMLKAPNRLPLAVSIQVLSGYVEQAFFLEPKPDLRAMNSVRSSWFSAAALGGNYGGGVALSVATLRWPYFFWRVAELEVAARGEFYGFASLGTTLGMTFFMDRDVRHELQIGLSASCTAFSYRGRTLRQDGNLITEEREDSSAAWQEVSKVPVSREVNPADIFIGLTLGPEITYSWRFAKDSGTSLVLGLEAGFPVPGAAYEFSLAIQGDEEMVEKGELKKIYKQFPDVDQQRAGIWFGGFVGISL